MTTVYFKTDANFNPDVLTSENLKYYLELVVREMAECLNLHGVSFIYKNGALPKDYEPPISDDEIAITLKVNSIQGPLPCSERGVFIYFTPGDPKSKRLATSISKNIGNIYIDPSLVKMMALESDETSTGQRIPSVTIEICYVGNPEDLFWLRENIEKLAKSIVMSILEFCGIPFTQCQKNIFGFTNQDASIMVRPALNSDIVGSLKANTKIRLVGQWENWYIVFYNDNLGYIQTKCITI